MDNLLGVCKIQCEYELHSQQLGPTQTQLLNELESKREECNNVRGAHHV